MSSVNLRTGSFKHERSYCRSFGHIFVMNACHDRICWCLFLVFLKACGASLALISYCHFPLSVSFQVGEMYLFFDKAFYNAFIVMKVVIYR